MIMVASLVAAGIAPTQARDFVQPLNDACSRFGIDTPTRIAAFLGQCMVESNLFASLEEGLFYRTPERIRLIFPSRVPDLQKASLLVANPKALANCVYAGKNGNGDEASGDGWRFHGRGLIQLTGRDNYTKAAHGVGVDYVELPQIVAKPVDACLTAAWYWHANSLNHLADSWQIDRITRAVNGPAMLESDRRRQYSETALRYLQ